MKSINENLKIISDKNGKSYLLEYFNQSPNDPDFFKHENSNTKKNDLKQVRKDIPLFEEKFKEFYY